MAWKYKQAYEMLMDEMFDEVSPETRTEISGQLDEIFGEKRRC